MNLKKLCVTFTLLLLFTETFNAQAFTFTTAPSVVCYTGGVVTVTAAQTASTPGAVTYSWNVISSNSNCASPTWTVVPLNGTVAVINFSCCGTYSIFHYAYAAANPTPINTTYQIFNVICGPFPTITVSNSAQNITICPGMQATLSATGAPFFAGSPTLVVSPTITTCYYFTGANSQSVLVSGCGSQGTACVNVAPKPILSFQLNSPICAGNSATISTGMLNHTYTWSTGSNSSSVIVNPSVSTVYTVTTDSSNCVSTTQTVLVQVQPPPSITITGSSFKICVGDTLVLSASGANSYTWSNNVTTFSTQVYPGVNTTYSVTGSNSLCSATSTVNITVFPIPSVTVASPAYSICAGSSVTLSAGGALSYSWSHGPTQGTTTVNPAQTTVYMVTGTDVNSCMAKAQVLVTVNQSPTLTVSGRTLVCFGETVFLIGLGANTYSWNGTAGAATIALSPSSSTNITLSGASNNGCSSTTTFSITMDLCHGVEKNFREKHSRLFPNPATQFIALQNYEENELTYNVRNTSGSVVFSGKLAATTTIDVSTLEEGIYFIEFKLGSEITFEKFLVKH